MFGQSINFNIGDISLFEEITWTTEEDIIENYDPVFEGILVF